MTTLTLTQDQQSALEAFNSFMCNPDEQVFVLSGYSGTGKSTLVKTLLDKLPGFMKMARLVAPDLRNYEVALTATTNKAAENFRAITGEVVDTIHSFLGLRVQTNYSTQVVTLVPRNGAMKENYLLFVDEASFIDKALLGWIFKLTKNCKVVFIGDPAQLAPVKAVGTPVFDAKFSGAHLSQVVRQAEGNPIVELSTKFRETVNSGEFFSFKPDGNAIIYLGRDSFNKAIEKEFTRPDWKYADSKVLGYTNKCVVEFNQTIRNQVMGSPHFEVGDYAVCNSFITIGRKSLKTDQMVCITDIGPEHLRYGVPGRYYTLDTTVVAFMANSLKDKAMGIKLAKASGDTHMAEVIESQFIDLRSAYACTINKAQGSTFDKVYLDLDDIRKVTSGDTLARMMYVGVSRAKSQVFLTGDLV